MGYVQIITQLLKYIWDELPYIVWHDFKQRPILNYKIIQKRNNK